MTSSFRTGTKTPKRTGIAARRRDKKRTEAEARQERYAALSTEQKLALIETRPGESARERARLAA